MAKSDEKKYRYQVVCDPLDSSDSRNSFLLFESRYYAEKYLVDKLLCREEEFHIDGKFDLNYQISKIDEGYIILAVASAVV